MPAKVDEKSLGATDQRSNPIWVPPNTTQSEGIQGMPSEMPIRVHKPLPIVPVRPPSPPLKRLPNKSRQSVSFESSNFFLHLQDECTQTLDESFVEGEWSWSQREKNVSSPKKEKPAHGDDFVDQSRSLRLLRKSIRFYQIPENLWLCMFLSIFSPRNIGLTSQH